MVLPFRILRPEPSIEFLAFSLPDAITVSLSGLESLVVRSSLAAASLTGDQLDLRALAADANVDAIVTGSLLPAGGLVRVSVQLVELPSGTVLWSHAFQVPLDDMFQIQDAVCSAVVEALALPLSSREQRLLRRDVPSSSEAYAHYLRANRLSSSSRELAAGARSLSAGGRGRSELRAGVGALRTPVARDEQVRARSRRARAPRRGRRGVPARVPDQPGAVGRAQSLHLSRSRERPRARGDDSAARTRARADAAIPSCTRDWSMPAATPASSMPRLPRSSGRAGSIRRSARAWRTPSSCRASSSARSSSIATTRRI